MSTSPVSLASVTGPNQSLFARFNPLQKIGTSLGSALSTALGIGPTEADFKKANPTISVATSLPEIANATKVNAANMLGVNLKTATTAQMAQVNAKASELLNTGRSPMLLSSVDRANGVQALAQGVMPAPTTTAQQGGGLFGFLGQAVTAIAPSLVQTGIAAYQYKNDPLLREERRINTEYLRLQDQAMKYNAEQSAATYQLEQENIRSRTELEKAKIQAESDAMKTAMTLQYGSVVPPAQTQPGTIYPPVASSMGDTNSNLAVLLASMMASSGGAQPAMDPNSMFLMSMMAPRAGAPVTEDLSILQAQQAELAAAGQSGGMGRNLLISAIVIGGVIFVFTRKNQKGKRR